MKIEAIARWFLILLLPAMLLAALLLRSQATGQAVTLKARMPEQGGWLPADLTVQAGEPLHLRLTSDAVLHGFAIGQSDLPAVDVYPGQTTELTLNFDEPGKYTYYCTRWCGANHWRMRGSIEVLPAPGMPIPPAEEAAGEQPLFLQLGVKLDEPRHSDTLPPQGRPDARRGQALGVSLPEGYLAAEYYRTHSPLEVWASLRQEPVTATLGDQQVWDLVAWVWRQGTTPSKLAEGQALYARDCAACHGESGAGDGVMADEVAAEYAASAEFHSGSDHAMNQPGEGSAAGPVDFTDPHRALATSPVIQEGKIVRGGMGTGMPYWGPIFTEEQVWALVDTLWTFQFDY